MDALKDLVPVAQEVLAEVEAGNLDPETVIRVEIRRFNEDIYDPEQETFVEWDCLPDPRDPTLARVYTWPAAMLAHIARIHADKAAAAQTEA